jgi:iron(III) transport system permease protein
MRYSTFTRAIFIRYTSSFDRTGAAVLGVVLATVTMVVLVGESLLRSRYQRRVQARTLAPPSPIRLGRWRWPAIGFLALVVLLALGMPLGVLIYWLVNGLETGARLPSVWEPLRHSLVVAACGAVITVLLALPVAILATRYAGMGSKTVEQAAFITHSLPGLVVALALVFFGINYARPLYETVWLMLFAYVILFLPNALASLRGPLIRQNMKLEEAAQSLGRRPLQVLWSVTLPLARPGIIAGLALVFLTIIKELPATLLLSPPGYRTLPGVIWSHSSEAFYAGAALPALVLLGAAAIPVAILVWRGEVEGVSS